MTPLAASHADLGVLFLILTVLFVLGAGWLVAHGEYLGAVACAVIAVLIAVFLA